MNFLNTLRALALPAFFLTVADAQTPATRTAAPPTVPCRAADSPQAGSQRHQRNYLDAEPRRFGSPALVHYARRRQDLANGVRRQVREGEPSAAGTSMKRPLHKRS